MGKKGWIILLLALGVGGAIVIGLLGQSQTVAERQLCGSLEALQSDVESLASTAKSDPSSLEDGGLQTALSEIDDDWDSVKSDAQDVANLDLDSLDDAWGTFQSTVKGISSDASAADIESTVSAASQTFVSEVQSTIGDLDCS